VLAGDMFLGVMEASVGRVVLSLSEGDLMLCFIIAWRGGGSSGFGGGGVFGRQQRRRMRKGGALAAAPAAEGERKNPKFMIP